MKLLVALGLVALQSGVVWAKLAEVDKEGVALVEWVEYSAGRSSGLVLRASSPDSATRIVNHWLVESPVANRLLARCESSISEGRSWDTACKLREPISNWALEHRVSRNIDAKALPFSREVSQQETEAIFDRMIARPDLTREWLAVDGLAVSYSAGEALRAAGDQPTMIYGMRRLAELGFSKESIPEAVTDAVRFAWHGNCLASDSRNVKGDALCDLIRHSGLLDSTSDGTGYESFGLESGGQRERDRPLPPHVDELLEFGRLRVAEGTPSGSGE